LRESTGANDENYFFLIVIFYGKILSKQSEILSSCGKGQGQHMAKIKKKEPFVGQLF
jgi:hypothetical protein